MSKTYPHIGLKGLGSSSKRLFAAIMEQSPDYIYIKDLNSRFIAISKTLAKAFGLETPEDAIGKSDFDFFTKEHAQQAFEDEQRILRTGEPILGKVEKETWEDDSVTWASSTKAPIVLENGQIVGLIGISRNVTTEHMAQEALKERERMLKERDEHISKDLRSARHVQQVLIPGEVPKVTGLNFALRIIPMDAVGGDVITFPKSGSEGLQFFLGDVTGHGVTAALFTMLVKYLADREGRKYQGSPQKILRNLNDGLVGRIPDGFVAGVHVDLVRNPDGTARLRASNAGQPEFIHYKHSSKKAELVKLPLGNVLGLPLEAGSLDQDYPLEKGDRVLFFTDGIIEIPNEKDEEFGFERLATAFGSIADDPVEVVADKLIAAAKEFAHGSNPRDDLTLIVIEVD